MKTREQVNDQGITLDASVLVSGHVKIINGDTVIDGKIRSPADCFET